LEFDLSGRSAENQLIAIISRQCSSNEMKNPQ
jgi:hypothetical protein